MSGLRPLRAVAKQESLGEVATLRSGKTPSSKNPRFWGGQVPWYTAKDLKSFYLTDSIDHISHAAVADGSPLGTQGDVLVLVRGMTLLKDVPVGLLYRPGSFNQDLKLVSPSPRATGEYLAYLLTAARPQLMSMVTTAGHGTGRLDIDRLKELPVWVPCPDTQNWLTGKLRLLEAVFAKLQELIELAHQRKRGLAHQLLTGEKRFPAFRGTPWSDVRFGDVFKERAETNCDDLPLLSVTGDRGIIPRDQLTKRDTSNADKSKYKRVAVGDIAYNTMRMWQGVSALSSLEGIISPAYTVVVPTERIDGAFAKHLFKLPPVVHVFHRHSQGLVDDTLNLKFKRFAKIRWRIPTSVEEQRKIAAVLDLCGVELALLEEQRRRYDLYKRGLMQRLLSGEIQVPA